MIEPATGTIRPLSGTALGLLLHACGGWAMASAFALWLPVAVGWVAGFVAASTWWFLAHGRWGVLQTALAFTAVAGVCEAIAHSGPGWVLLTTVFVSVTCSGAACPVVQVVEVTGVVDGDIETVFAAMTEHPRIAAHPGVASLTVIQPGEPVEHGPGAIREVELPRATFREQVVAWDPPTELEYRIVQASVPIEHIEGLILLEPVGAGTRVIWRSGFIARVPFLAGLIGRWAANGMARDLAEHLDGVGALLLDDG